ncbi:MAG: HD domain-containing protein, partial [Caldimicrobium sp.]
MKGEVKENVKNIRTKLALGGLLHDIGKITLRFMSEEEIKVKYGAVSREVDYKEDYKYAHAYNTMLILEHFGIKDPIILASAYHHQPSKAGSEESQLYAKLYSLADRLSSVERSEKESKEEIPLLYSIFQNINFSLRHNDSSSKGSEREEYVYLPKPLDLSKETLFPKKSKELKNIYGANLKESHELKKLYKGLWESFRRDFEVVSS